MSDKKEDILIAAFMGFLHATEITRYNYGMDFNHSYDKETIYSNMVPKLVTYEEKFGTQVVDTHHNYYNDDEQEDDFKALTYLNYKSWNNLMPVIDKIEELGYRVTLQKHQCQVWDLKPSKENIERLGDLAGFLIDADFHDDKLQNAYEAVTCFIELHNKKND